MTIAEAIDYSAVGKNLVQAVEDIMLVFIDSRFIDAESFSKMKNIFSDFVGDFVITEEDGVAPMTLISMINQTLGIGMFVEDNLIKLFYIPETISGGIEVKKNMIKEDAVFYYNFDYYRDKVIVLYTDGVADYSTAAGTGNKILEIDTTQIIISQSVAEKIAARNLPLYNKIYESLEIVLDDDKDIEKIGKVLSYKNGNYIMKNIVRGNNSLTITGIGG